MRRAIIMPTLIAHGGAGGRAPAADRTRRRAGILAAVERGAEILRDGGAALDAVVATVVALENDPLFNAGYGSVLTVAGRVEMDAAVMSVTGVQELPNDGSRGSAESIASAANSSGARRRVVPVEVRAGGVVLVSRVRNPIELARAVMERTPHLLMGGTGAEALARQTGLRMCRPADLVSQRARERWLASNGEEKGSAADGATRSHGTVGAVAIDSHRNIAAATSTGGVSGKLPGRIGDSAIVGAGVFADVRGGASATGEGEAIMRIALCREAVTALDRNRAQAATERAIAMIAEATDAQAGLILVDSRGGVGYAHNAEVMEVALFNPLEGFRHQVVEPVSSRATSTDRIAKAPRTRK